MRYLRFIFFIMPLSFLMASPSIGESIEYKAGRAAAYIDYCGKYQLSIALNKKYGKNNDFRKGESDNDLSGYDSVNGLDCDGWENFIDKLLSVKPKIKRSEEKKACSFALGKNNLWETRKSLKVYVEKAKLLRLSEQECARILGRITTVASSSAPASLKNKTNYMICHQALSVNGARWDDKNAYFRLRVDEAKSRGLSEQDCARILGRATAVASSKSSYNNLSDSTNRTICSMALGRESNWDTANISEKYILEAKSRGLSEQNCVQVLGRTPTVASKPDPQPSLALVKRTQEALKSLGLYRGAVDGIVGVQSKSALKQWQKTAGLDATGDINYTQIAQLESDALEELAKQEQERKAKAKRLAEANKIKNPDAIAVIIGNRDYKGDTPDVEFAVNDADAMREFVLSKLGYRSGNIIDLRDATQAELLSAFGSKESHQGRLFDYVRADTSDVIVFYSGHGVPGMSDKRGYLLSVDADPNRAELTGYPVDTLLKNLSKIPAKSMTVFIDACFSGNTPKGMLVDSMSGLTVEIRQPKKVTKGMVVLTASRGDQVASWDKNAKHGLFTKHLLEALNGAADKQSTTGNQDGKVTLGEVKAYLDREMTYQARRRFSRDQHATVSGDLKTVLSAY